MKVSVSPSESTNSLTVLNHDGLTCFFCLEEVKENYVTSSMFKSCACNYKVHSACWNDWMKGKIHYDCPICRVRTSVLGEIPAPFIVTISVEEGLSQGYIERREFILLKRIVICMLLIFMSILLWRLIV